MILMSLNAHSFKLFILILFMQLFLNLSNAPNVFFNGSYTSYHVLFFCFVFFT